MKKEKKVDCSGQMHGTYEKFKSIDAFPLFWFQYKFKRVWQDKHNQTYIHFGRSSK